MEKDIFLIIIAFLTLIVVINLLPIDALISDTGQYIASAKEFAGIGVAKAHNPHSWSYGLFLAQFIKLFYFLPYLLVIKIVNSLWLLLDLILIYLITRDKKALLLWFFSPIVWITVNGLSPILPVSFLILLAYYSFKLYENKNERKYFIMSALILGLAPALWWPALIIGFLFILVFFYDKRFLSAFIYILFFLITMSSEFIINYIYFNFPLFSFIRNFGAQLYVRFFRIRPEFILPLELYLLFSFLATPLIYKLYKLSFSKYKRELIFILMAVLFYFLIRPNPRYMISIAPMIIVLVSRVVKRRDLILHIILSALIISYFYIPSVTSEHNKEIRMMVNDLYDIANEFPNEKFIMGSDENIELASLTYYYDGGKIKEAVWWQDYNLSVLNETHFDINVRLESESKINNLRKLYIEAGLIRTDDRSYDDVKYIITDRVNASVPERFKLIKSYNVLHLFKKE